MAPADPPSRQSDLSLPQSSCSPSSQHRSTRRAALATIGTAATSTLPGCNALTNNTDPAPFHDGNWYSYGNSPTNTNRVNGGVPKSDEHDVFFPSRWTYVPPVVHEGVAYFATDKQVVAVMTDGTERWSRRLDTEVSGTPALDPDRSRLYVPTRVVGTSDTPEPTPASVTVLSLADGDVVDTWRVGDGRTYGVTVAAGDVYARSATACVRLTSDGTERWRQPLDPLSYDAYNLGDSTATQVAPAVADHGVYVPDRDALVKLALNTGEEQWRVAVDTPYAASVVDDDLVIQTGWQETVAVERTGAIRWRRDLHSRAAAAVADGVVYVVAGDLHEIGAGTGETNWQAHLPSEGTAAPDVTDQDVLVTSGDVRAFRREAGGGILSPERERWHLGGPGRRRALRLLKGHVLGRP
ncbi:PQQ-binding-like beta-propeller repeat protein [Halostella sp. JP-L12]|uniref:outer membrane protein assembly factor BamB family protein n=1 Tax=Halostella TaxID=1843185 RepID=UPI000EF80993|nr:MULTISPECIES: PQQ-binding-like beta-propeller repeat protein [Halostella]NHN49315.1 PQQ-binding-like beta-propeller repeat protein [Halostella sp. JP-L12]